MEFVEGFDHRPGVHCGATALRNVAGYYGWNYSEAACFGIGGGPTFLRYGNGRRPTFRTSPLRLERAFFERAGVPHAHRAGDDFETAWADVTSRIEANDPVVCFLDPSALAYLDDEGHHQPPHVAVVIGHEEERVQLSDAALPDRQELSLSALETAWTSEGSVPLRNEYLVVTRARRARLGNDAAAAGLRQAATAMLRPGQAGRDARAGEATGLPALRSFADTLERWAGLDDPQPPVRAAVRSLDEHGDDTAFRGLFAESLAELGQRTGLPTALAGRMTDVAASWRTVVRLLESVLSGTARPGTFAEAATVVADIADREAALFESLAGELGQGARAD
jgi:hypothetical protein